MTDRPILFSAPMIRALLEGRKTQTRRVITPKNDAARFLFFQDWTDDYILKAGWRFLQRTHGYAIGDRLWVREAWRADSQMDAIAPSNLSQYEPRFFEANSWLIEPTCSMIKPGRLRASMHMPRWASRLTLLVTDVRVQRLQDISKDDARQEGIPNAPYAVRPDLSFKSLWDSINANPRPRYGLVGGKKCITHYESFPWAGETRTETHRGKPHHITPNPWVVAPTFEVVHSNIDAIEVAA